MHILHGNKDVFAIYTVSEQAKKKNCRAGVSLYLGGKIIGNHNLLYNIEMFACKLRAVYYTPQNICNECNLDSFIRTKDLKQLQESEHGWFIFDLGIWFDELKIAIAYNQAQVVFVWELIAAPAERFTAFSHFAQVHLVERDFFDRVVKEYLDCKTFF